MEYYGTPTPLNQIAGISTPDPHHRHPALDRSVLSAIERALIKSEIGITPNVDGTGGALSVPPYRGAQARDGSRFASGPRMRVELRVHRRDVADHLKKGLRDGSLSEDESGASWRRCSA